MSWDGFTAEQLMARLQVPRVALFAQLDSTMNVGHALAENDAPTGTVVLADSQTSARGRHGRPWSSPPGSGVYCTIIDRPRDAPGIELLSIRIGLSLAENLDDIAGERVRVKWPNDVLLRSGKVAGVLTEARWAGPRLAWVCIGVGVNVSLPAGVAGAAGLPRGTRRVDVLAAIVDAVGAASSRTGDMTAEELERFAERDAIGEREIVAPGRGRAAGISPSGALLIDTARGREQHRAGTIRFAEDS